MSFSIVDQRALRIGVYHRWGKWEEVKRLSNNFKNKVAEALKADALLYELIKPKKGAKVKETKEQARIRIRERERMRKIKILALELEMTTINQK